MPKPFNIDWSKFPELTGEQAREMQEFLDVAGEAAESAYKVTINQEFVEKQIADHLETYQLARNAEARMAHYSKLREECQMPEEAKNIEMLGRGINYYLTDDRAANQALMDSLKTRDGRQAMMNRMARDLMAEDLVTDVGADIKAEIARYARDPAKEGLMWIAQHTAPLTNTSNTTYTLDDPLRTALEEKVLLLVAASSGEQLHPFAASPLGLLLPCKIDSQEAVSDNLSFFTEMSMAMTGANPERKMLLGNYMKYFQPMIDASYCQQSGAWKTMKEEGMLANNIRLQNAAGKYIDKKAALVEIAAHREVRKEELSPEISLRLKEQMESLPVTEKAAHEAHEKRMQDNGILKESAQVPGAYYMEKDGECQLVTMKMSQETGKLEPVAAVQLEEPQAPKAPGWLGLKRLIHSLFSNAFERELREYDAEMGRYNGKKAHNASIRNEQSLARTEMEEKIQQRKSEAERQKAMEKAAQEAEKRIAAEAEKQRVKEQKEAENRKLFELTPEEQTKYNNTQRKMVNEVNHMPKGPHKAALGLSIFAMQKMKKGLERCKGYPDMATDFKIMVVEQILAAEEKGLEKPLTQFLDENGIDTEAKLKAELESKQSRISLGSPMDAVIRDVSMYTRPDGRRGFHHQGIQRMKDFIAHDGAQKVGELCRQAMKVKEAEKEQKPMMPGAMV